MVTEEAARADWRHATVSWEGAKPLSRRRRTQACCQEPRQSEGSLGAPAPARGAVLLACCVAQGAGRGIRAGQWQKPAGPLGSLVPGFSPAGSQTQSGQLEEPGKLLLKEKASGGRCAGASPGVQAGAGQLPESWQRTLTALARLADSCCRCWMGSCQH